MVAKRVFEERREEEGALTGLLVRVSVQYTKPESIQSLAGFSQSLAECVEEGKKGHATGT